MNIRHYSSLIRALPLDQHASTTKRRTWENSLAPSSLPKEIECIFCDKQRVCISRKDIFRLPNGNAAELKRIIYSTIFWGYPAGMRHDYFQSIVKNVTTLVDLLQTVIRDGCGIDTWDKHFTQVDKIRGLGLSTYSKLLYFLRVKLDNMSALILDSRLLDVFKKQPFKEFQSLGHLNYNNAPRNYPVYLSKMHQQAGKIDVQADSIEMFLFTFGNCLKKG